MMSFADAQPIPTDCSSIGVDRFRQDLLDRRAADKRKTAELSTSRSRKKNSAKKNSPQKKFGREKSRRGKNSPLYKLTLCYILLDTECSPCYIARVSFHR